MSKLCDNCNKNIASIIYKEVVNGVKKEFRLCTECAHKDQLDTSELKFFTENIKASSDFFQENIDSTVENIFNAIFGDYLQAIDGVKKKEVVLSCENCGMTFEKFKEVNKLGCAHCYSTFREQLKVIFNNIQKSSTHQGKIPKKSGVQLILEKEIEQLKAELQKSISAEEYENAAIIRDKIKKLNIDN